MAKGDYALTSWADIQAWIADVVTTYKVEAEVVIAFRPNRTDGAYCEAVLYATDGLNPRRELVRTRQPFDLRKKSGHPGMVLYSLWQAINELDNNPWLWPYERRKQARGGE